MCLAISEIGGDTSVFASLLFISYLHTEEKTAQMKKFVLLATIVFTHQFSGISQPACTGSGLYVDSVFACVDVSPDIQFATGVKDWGWGNVLCLDLNFPPYNTQLPLRLDLYEPCGDTASARPLIIAIHGGAWAGGNKGELEAFGDYMAKRGFVVASVSYRLSLPGNILCWPGEVDSIRMHRAAMRGIQDAKAAVRYFRANAGVFRIDPDYIFALGVSAGAFNALGLGYMDDQDERPGACDAQPQYGEWLGNLLLPDMGSIEGNGGNPSQSSAVRAVVSLSGAVTSLDVFDGPDDPPLLAFHGDADDVVPYGYDCALQGLIDLGLFDKCIRVNGPEVYIPAAQALGVSAELVTFPGGGHEITPEQLEVIVAETTDFFCEQMWAAVAVQEKSMDRKVEFFPNPVSGGQALIKVPDQYQGSNLGVYDLNGRMLLYAPISSSPQALDLSHFPPGLYIWKIQGKACGASGKFIVE